ncbi:hypothetical protein KIH31_03960 [Paenarthrobacter sp. DKR-5]|uniref:hypothetical protein n=1 Tax=Paenarthrobacter sp. DKR-5 TaxID=2835535 RepID=UPI001BDD322A|nr:hypothetical protein [Paenarthrobacter sp. DKR-5]MBT1001749.1 hypothetical protein [Paenarthrobacter sp. DKR-5]
MSNIYGLLEWVLALVAAVTGVWALVLSEALSSNSGPSLKRKPGSLVVMASICSLATLCAFVVGIVAMRNGTNGA